MFEIDGRWQSKMINRKRTLSAKRDEIKNYCNLLI